LIAGANNTVGGTGPLDGNQIVLSGQDGILITGSGATGNQLLGNSIGTNYAGNRALGNSRNGVHLVNASNNTIGNALGAAPNIITANGSDGVLVDTGTNNAIRQNSIFNSGHLGIELVNDGNNTEPYPVLTAATSTGTTTTGQRTITGRPGGSYDLEFYANTVRNPSGFGEGHTFLGTATVTTGTTGSATFNVTLNVGVAVGQYVSATASDAFVLGGNTSPFAADVVVAPGDGPGALVASGPTVAAGSAAVPATAAAPVESGNGPVAALAGLPVGGSVPAPEAAPPAVASVDPPLDGVIPALDNPLDPAPLP